MRSWGIQAVDYTSPPRIQFSFPFWIWGPIYFNKPPVSVLRLHNLKVLNRLFVVRVYNTLRAKREPPTELGRKKKKIILRLFFGAKNKTVNSVTNFIRTQNRSAVILKSKKAPVSVYFSYTKTFQQFSLSLCRTAYHDELSKKMCSSNNDYFKLKNYAI